MAKDHGKQIKDDEQYEALRKKGYSKEKSARIANAKGDRSKTGKTGGRASAYEDRTRQELYEKARQVGIEGRSRMSKQELIDHLRNH